MNTTYYTSGNFSHGYDAAGLGQDDDGMLDLIIFDAELETGALDPSALPIEAYADEAEADPEFLQELAEWLYENSH